MANSAHNPDGFNKDRARRLVGMYVFGVAVGCVLVGVMLNMKKYFRPPAAATPPAQSAPADGGGTEPAASDAVGTPETPAGAAGESGAAGG